MYGLKEVDWTTLFPLIKVAESYRESDGAQSLFIHPVTLTIAYF